jgi:hypothetical protein
MKIQIIIPIIVVFFSVINIKAQNIETKIEKQFMDYSALMIEKNFDKALDYTNEEFFKIIPKEQLITLLNKTMNSTEMEYKAHLPSLSDFQEVKNIDGKNYVKFVSSSFLEIKFIETENDKNITEEEKKLNFSLYKLSFENKFGEKNVKFNEETKYFEIQASKNVIASSDEKMENWKFAIVENDNQKKILERFIPKELFDGK